MGRTTRAIRHNQKYTLGQSLLLISLVDKSVSQRTTQRRSTSSESRLSQALSSYFKPKMKKRRVYGLMKLNQQHQPMAVRDLHDHKPYLLDLKRKTSPKEEVSLPSKRNKKHIYIPITTAWGIYRIRMPHAVV